jgi:arginine/serine-rich splicing factor 17
LYLKPTAKFNVSVALPSAITGKSISNYEIMEKMRQMILPEKFSLLKVSKSTVEFIRFEGEIEERAKLKHILGRLDGRPIRLAGFSESVKIRASEAKDDFPTRHDWDSFFRDANNMDEMKAGGKADEELHFHKELCYIVFSPQNGPTPSTSRIFRSNGFVRGIRRTRTTPNQAKVFSNVYLKSLAKFVPWTYPFVTHTDRE